MGLVTGGGIPGICARTLGTNDVLEIGAVGPETGD